MSDDIDRAQNEVDRSLAEALRKRRPAGPVAKGRCHYCDEPVEGDQRWCDIECREGWETLTRRK
jgi:hypothetical protein